MKLLKKAAVGLLTTAMALSMLTACGGPSGGGGSTPANKPSNGGGNDTTVLEPVPGPDKTEDGESSEAEANKKPILAEDSKYAKSSKAIFGSQEFYIKVAQVTYDANQKAIDSLNMIMARKGTSVYMEMKGISDGKEYNQTVLELKEANGTYTDYLLFKDGNAALKDTGSKTGMADNFDKTSTLPSNMYATSVTVNGQKYYAESYVDVNGYSAITCFDKKDLPVYDFTNQGETTETTVYQSILLNSQGLCVLPSGCAVYTQELDDNNKLFLVDSANRKYLVNPITNDAGRLTAFTILDTSNNNKDVSDQFGWYIKYITARYVS